MRFVGPTKTSAANALMTAIGIRAVLAVQNTTKPAPALMNKAKAKPVTANIPSVATLAPDMIILKATSLPDMSKAAVATVATASNTKLNVTLTAAIPALILIVARRPAKAQAVPMIPELITPNAPAR